MRQTFRIISARNKSVCTIHLISHLFRCKFFAVISRNQRHMRIKCECSVIISAGAHLHFRVRRGGPPDNCCLHTSLSCWIFPHIPKYKCRLVLYIRTTSRPAVCSGSWVVYSIAKECSSRRSTWRNNDIGYQPYLMVGNSAPSPCGLLPTNQNSSPSYIPASSQLPVLRPA